MQAVTAVRFYKPKQSNYQEISIKIDTGSAITLMRYLILKEQGIPYRELAQFIQLALARVFIFMRGCS